MNKSPIKWVGSKARLMPVLKNYLPEGRRLVEPFGGSCSVMLNTDYDEYLIADINRDLINLFERMKDSPSAVIVIARALFEKCNNAEDYYRIRNEFNMSALHVEMRAAVFLYLNRHGYNGMARYNQGGEFNVPYGKYKKPYFPEKEILLFSEKARRATFICTDYTETLPLVRPGDVVYCDPPYHSGNACNAFTQYYSAGFDERDHLTLTGMLTGLPDGVSVVVSNSDNEHTRNMFARFDVVSVSAPRSIGAATGGNSTAPEIIAVRRPTMYVAPPRTPKSLVNDRMLDGMAY